MAILKYIQQYGNQFKAIFDDGTFKLALPTGNDLWIISGTGGSNPPDPGSNPPDPGSGDFMWPIPLDYVTSEYGPRTGGAGTFHEGIDLSTGGGYAIKAAGAGTVEANYFHNNFGNMVIIDHGTLSDGARYRTLYAHMVNPSPLAVNSTVAKGDIVGIEGESGGAYGAHLHLEVHKGGTIVWNLKNNGGYRSAINARDFMTTFGE